LLSRGVEGMSLTSADGKGLTTPAVISVCRGGAGWEGDLIGKTLAPRRSRRARDRLPS
jgi:hypothetical protein